MEEWREVRVGKWPCRSVEVERGESRENGRVEVERGESRENGRVDV